MSPEPSLEQNFELGPYLTAALICERVLQESDGVTSAIRIIDRVTHTIFDPSPSREMEPFSYDLEILVMLKSGEHPGMHKLSIQPIKPSNEKIAPMNYTINLEAPADRGFNLRARVRMLFDEAGLWWFDISLNGKRITRIPFRVLYQPQETKILGGP